MAELTLSASDIAAAITKGLEGYKPSTEARTVGRVAEVGDGIARTGHIPRIAARRKIARVIVHTQKVIALCNGVQIALLHWWGIGSQMLNYILRIDALVQSVHVQTENQAVV